jgi:hypothetical protein
MAVSLFLPAARLCIRILALLVQYCLPYHGYRSQWNDLKSLEPRASGFITVVLDYHTVYDYAKFVRSVNL